MPFTFAHPAAVLWCARWRTAGVPLSAFVIGAMSPDFEYLIRLRTVSVYFHTLPGIVLCCIPLGMLVHAIYKIIVERPLRDHLPAYVQRRVPPPDEFHVAFRPRTLLLSAVAVGFGAVTHTVWDGFTHYHGVFVPVLPWLREELADIRIHRYLQHGSTLFGFLIIAWWLHRQPPRYPAQVDSPVRGYAAVVASGTVAAFFTLLWIAPLAGWVTWILCGMNAAGAGLVAGGLWARLACRWAIAV